MKENEDMYVVVVAIICLMALIHDYAITKNTNIQIFFHFTPQNNHTWYIFSLNIPINITFQLNCVY